MLPRSSPSFSSVTKTPCRPENCSRRTWATDTVLWLNALIMARRAKSRSTCPWAAVSIVPSAEFIVYIACCSLNHYGPVPAFNHVVMIFPASFLTEGKGKILALLQPMAGVKNPRLFSRAALDYVRTGIYLVGRMKRRGFLTIWTNFPKMRFLKKKILKTCG